MNLPVALFWEQASKPGRVEHSIPAGAASLAVFKGAGFDFHDLKSTIVIDVLRQLLTTTLSFVLAVPASYNSYDAVGNRQQLTSTVPAIPAGTMFYDADDRFTAGDTYDANGDAGFARASAYNRNECF